MRFISFTAALPALLLSAGIGVQAFASNSAEADRALRIDDAKFGVFVAGIRIGNFNLAARSNGNSYGTSAAARETGLASWLTDFSYSASARGWVGAGGRLVPMSFEESLVENGEPSSTAIKFNNGEPHDVAMTGEPEGNETPLDPFRQGSVLDPLSAIYTMVRDVRPSEACSSSFYVFDGVRRSRVSLGEPKSIADGFECPSRYERIEGWTEDEMNEQKVFPFNLRYGLIEERGGWYRMIELSAPTSLGSFKLRRAN